MRLAYSLTLLTHQRACLFGEIVDGAMHLNETGCVVAATWQRLPHRFEVVALDAYVVMPNHLHAIVWAGARDALERGLDYFTRATTRWVSDRGAADAVRVWQRLVLTSAVAGPAELDRTRARIAAEPSAWDHDGLNPRARRAWSRLRTEPPEHCGP